MTALYTERCLLQRLRKQDIEEAVQLYTDKEVRAFLGGTIPEELAILKLKSWIDNEEGQYFCIRLKKDFEFIGMIYYAPYHEGDCTELSYELLPSYWGMGYAREVVKRMLTYGRDSLCLDYIVSETQAVNIRSRTLLECVGFTTIKEVIRFNERQIVYHYQWDKIV